MRCVVSLKLLAAWILLAAWCRAGEPDKDVSWKAEAEVARRGALVERINGLQDTGDPVSAISAAMQPPADDSHKWLFTLVVTKNCQWCEKLRGDFETNPKLKSWVDTKDYTKSWAHWQVVQIEDKSQEWRWKDFRPNQFPTLIVQPPVNGSWGDAHTIVFVRQGYLPPDQLDVAIRKAIQLYAAKAFPRHLAWQSQRGDVPVLSVKPVSLQGGAEQSGGWNPPVTPPTPLPPVPGTPSQTFPPLADPAAGGALNIPLALPSAATILLLLTAVSNIWMLYREIAQQAGIKLLVSDEQAKKLMDLLAKLQGGATPPPAAA